jgi:hypothetical protein
VKDLRDHSIAADAEVVQACYASSRVRNSVRSTGRLCFKTPQTMGDVPQIDVHRGGHPSSFLYASLCNDFHLTIG